MVKVNLKFPVDTENREKIFLILQKENCTKKQEQ